MKDIFKNLMKVLKSPIWLFWIILWIIIISIPSFLFIRKEHFVFNEIMHLFYLEVSLSIIIAVLFWIFLWATLYKMKYFSTAKKSDSSVWVIAWFLWVLVSGCPACSISLASIFWLAGFIQFFPYWWIELKIISVVFLLYAWYSTLKNLEVCKLKPKKS